MSQEGKKLRVVYWNNIPAPYVIDRFNAVADRGNLDFEAWFSRRTLSERSWHIDPGDWRFKYQIFRDGPGGFPLPTPLFNPSRKFDLIMSLYADPEFILGRLLTKVRRISHAYWVVKTFDTWVQRNGLKELVKRRILDSADRILCPGTDAMEYAGRYIRNKDRVSLFPHSIDCDHYAKALDIEDAVKDALKRDLGLEHFVFLYVGRLNLKKGLVHLLDAFAGIASEYHNVSLLLVGDGKDEAALREYCQGKHIDRVTFAGFIDKAAIHRYYAISDAFVFPTLGDPYGLVVDEAMVSGVPVISTSAAGEIEDRIKDSRTGYIVEQGSDIALFNAMKSFLDLTEADRKQMKANSSAMFKHRNAEWWAGEFERYSHEICQRKGS